MRLSDIEGLLRSHLVEGETMVEEPSDYFDDRMYTISTVALPAHAYTIQADGLYAIGAEGALEPWYNDMADYKEEIERLLLRALDEARNPIDFDAFDRGNR